jgi:predicted DNA-binding WGR domain protein
MITQPYTLYVERIAPQKNMARFYALAVEPTLFGEVSLVRTWGRIGTRGQQMVHLFDNENHAVSLFLDVLREKRKRGYRPKRPVDIQGIHSLVPTVVDDNSEIS